MVVVVAHHGPEVVVAVGEGDVAGWVLRLRVPPIMLCRCHRQSRNDPLLSSVRLGHCKLVLLRVLTTVEASAMAMLSYRAWRRVPQSSMHFWPSKETGALWLSLRLVPAVGPLSQSWTWRMMCHWLLCLMTHCVELSALCLQTWCSQVLLGSVLGRYGMLHHLPSSRVGVVSMMLGNSLPCCCPHFLRGTIL